MNETTTEFVRFRLFSMPCCGQLLCWVNPRLPNHCPECGKKIYMELKFNPDKYLKGFCNEAKLVMKLGE